MTATQITHDFANDEIVISTIAPDGTETDVKRYRSSAEVMTDPRVAKRADDAPKRVLSGQVLQPPAD